MSISPIQSNVPEVTSEKSVIRLYRKHLDHACPCLIWVTSVHPLWGWHLLCALPSGFHLQRPLGRAENFDRFLFKSLDFGRNAQHHCG